jgi:hypothetical protein
VTDTTYTPQPSVPPAGSTWARSRFELWALAHPDNAANLRRVLDAVRLTTSKPRRSRRPSLTHLAAKAKKLGVALTREVDGAVTVRADNTADPAINEWDAELIHGKH